MIRFIPAIAALSLLAAPAAFAQDKPKAPDAKHECCCAKEKGGDCSAACARNNCKGACAKKGHHGPAKPKPEPKPAPQP